MNQPAVCVEDAVAPESAGAVFVAAGNAGHLRVSWRRAVGEVWVVDDDYAIGGFEARNVRASCYDLARAIRARD